MSPGQQETRIPRRPLLWLATALLFTVPPMFGTLAPWVPLTFMTALVAKFWMERKGVRLRSLVWKAVFVAVTFTAIILSYGSLTGIEPGLSVFIILMALKILEAHTAREFRRMLMFGWIVCLSGFFSSQDLTVALCEFAAFALLLTALIQFHRGSSRVALWPPLRMAGKLLIQALPLAAILFLLFPRTSGVFRFRVPFSNTTSSGFSDRLSPGSIASIASSTDVAFRAEFPDGAAPSLGSMYWRGAVLWQGNGLEWQGGAPAAVSGATQLPAGERIRQRITIEPHGERWMFALDRPFEAPAGAVLAPGNCLRGERELGSSRRYEVTSYREIHEGELRGDERKASLQLPAVVSPAVRELVQSWTSENEDPRAVVKAALQFFRRGGFRYSLSPGEYKENALDEFLFHRRSGFCEHYAGSLATLLRLAGIPTRVVVGYLGGEFNDIGRYFLVRQADAHAWCEVWLPDRGWERVDPTSVVAPERVSLGFNSFLAMQAASGEPGAATGQVAALGSSTQRQFLHDIRLAWDSAKYAWDTRVLSFDAEAQQSFFTEIRMDDVAPLLIVVRTLLILAGVIAIYAAWMRLRSRRRPDPVKALYERFCRKIARLGPERISTEGPADFAARAALLLPNESEQIRQISSDYIALRYSLGPGILLEHFANEVNAFTPHGLRTPLAPRG